MTGFVQSTCISLRAGGSMPLNGVLSAVLSVYPAGPEPGGPGPPAGDADPAAPVRPGPSSGRLRTIQRRAGPLTCDPPMSELAISRNGGLQPADAESYNQPMSETVFCARFVAYRPAGALDDFPAVLKAASGRQFISGAVLYDGTMSLSFDDSLYAVAIRALWEAP